jgi:hypothetical protein
MLTLGISLSEAEIAGERELDKRLQPLLRDSKQDLALLRSFSVETAEQYEAAAVTRAKLKATMDAIESDRKTLVEKQDKWVRGINAKCKPVKDFLQAGINLLNAAIGAYQLREEKRQQEALIEAQQQALAGDVAGATLSLARVESQAPVVSGLSTRDDWTFNEDEVDVNLLPREFLQPDFVRIRAFVKAAKKEDAVPGVRAFVRKVISQRGVA